MSGPCEYCTRTAPEFMTPPESAEPIYLCSQCRELLKNPSTALPLIRGNLTLKLRGKIPEARLKELLDKYMSELAKFGPRN